MHGQCLCEQVQFEILGKLPRLYQCHCSQCRKQSGASSNTATVVHAGDFRWVKGQERISAWRHATGFRSHYCVTCGCPVPNPLFDQTYIWVPVGLLASTGHGDICVHLFVGSRADWEALPSSGIHCDTMPTLSEFVGLLHEGENLWQRQH